MAIKVTLGEAKPQEVKPFPKLMQCIKGDNYGMIVFMQSYACGTVLVNPKNWELGDYAANWSMELFEDYNFAVTLQNQ